MGVNVIMNCHIYTLLGLCILIQVFLAGLSIFASTTYWTFHKTFVVYFEFLPLLLMLLALLGRTQHK